MQQQPPPSEKSVGFQMQFSLSSLYNNNPVSTWLLKTVIAMREKFSCVCVQWLSGERCSEWSGGSPFFQSNVSITFNFPGVVQVATTILATDAPNSMAFEYLHRKTSCVETVMSHHRRLTVKTFRILEQVIPCVGEIVI